MALPRYKTGSLCSHRSITIFAILLLFFLLTSSMSPSIQPETTSINPTPTSTPAPTLRSLAQPRGISIGAAVSLQPLQTDPQYRDTLARQFNMLTPENAMKFAAIHPSRNTYTFEDADSIVAFAQAHNMQVRGHNLAWYKTIPSWVTKGNFSRTELINILREHIMTVVSHYRGSVNIWDVVNEAIDNNGALRDSVWLRVIGPDYIDLAFRWAHQANPQARLFYNDYDGEGLGRKSDAIYNLLKGLLQRGVPISGVGLQMHIGLAGYPKPQDVLANMKRLAALGLEVQITEMDVAIQGDPRSMDAKLAAQAQIYRDMLSACLAVQNCTAFVMWGFTDRYSWIPLATGHPDAPLIFDGEYRAKPAYDALLDVLTGLTIPSSISQDTHITINNKLSTNQKGTYHDHNQTTNRPRRRGPIYCAPCY